MSAKETIRLLNTFTHRDFATDQHRAEAIKACQTLLTKLQDPFERVWEMVVDVPALTASVKLCLDIGLFGTWQKSGNGEESCRSLATMVGFKQVDMFGNRFTLVLAFLTGSLTNQAAS